MTAALRTDLPRSDPRFPHWAPPLGALSAPYVDPREVSGMDPRLGQVQDTPEADLASREPIPELLIGTSVAAAGGALTGGVAAWSWRGAATGAAFSSGLWSLITLVSSWRNTAASSKALLGVSAVLGLGATAFLVVTRRKDGTP